MALSMKKVTYKSTKRRDFNSTEPSGLVLNKKGLKKFKEIAYENRDVEYLYLRENEFESFDPYIPLYNLKILDLSINNLTGSVAFLQSTPKLRHLYITGNKLSSFEGLSELPELETLCMSDNDITSFEGLDNLPNLRVLSLNYNSIDNFRSFPYLPELHTLNLTGNPIADVGKYRSMAIAASNPQLATVDGQPVTQEERESVEHFRGKVVYCITEGFLVEGDNVEEDADKFLVELQKSMQKAKPLQLLSVNLASGEEDSNLLTEGTPVDLKICMQDMRSLAERQNDIFFSRHLFPVAFKVSGDATEVFLVGAMNGWTEPIPLSRVEEGEEVYFQTTLYLPAGDYEYRYIVDGVEKINEANQVASKFKQGMCNIYNVTEAAVTDDDQETILHIRWMRSNPSHGFSLIEEQNTLSYTPGPEDIGFCLRAEVLAYVNGEFSFLYFDISTPITAGAPKCAAMDIKGDAKEGEHLDIEVEYRGGQEGDSGLQWYRVSDADGEEKATEITLDNPWDGYDVQIEDIGSKIRVTYTPMRDDWTAGQPETRETPIVTAGVPSCSDIRIVGDYVQEKELTAEYEYRGGFEGPSKFQWFRHDATEDAYVPLAGETNATYTPNLNDVNHKLAVEYTPVSRENIEGEPTRCYMDVPVAPEMPQLRSLEIKGHCEEANVLMLEFDYFGGYFGSHEIQWTRVPGDADPKKPVEGIPIGRPNAATCTMTRKEVGYKVRVTFTPVRDDGVKGEPWNATTDMPIAPGQPQVKTLQIVGDPALGAILEVTAEYFGGEQGESLIVWERAALHTNEFETIAKQTRRYVVQQEDTGRLLKVSYTPVRKDGEAGDVKTRLLEIPSTNQNDEPAQQQPAPTQEEPAPAQEEPKAEEPAPAAEEPAPATEEQPAAAEEKPAEEQPATAEGPKTEEQPATEEAKPEEQPAATEEPAPAAEEPKTEEQPAAAEETTPAAETTEEPAQRHVDPQPEGEAEPAKED